MDFFRAIMVLLCVCVFGIPAKAQDTFDASLAMQSVAENYVRPSYETLQQATANLKTSVEALCSMPTDDGLRTAKQEFAIVGAAWAKIEFFRSGPVMAENRVERILFFPDRKGTGLKQVQALIADEATAVPDPAQLADRSVAVQGLGALEFVLFGTGSEQLAVGAPHRCALGVSIAGNLNVIAIDLVSAWAKGGDTKTRWSTPGQNNPFARSDLEATNLLLGTIIHGLEAVRDLRLQPILGKNGAADKPKAALFWRSGLTLKMVIANLEGARDLFQAANLSAALPKEQTNLANTISFAFRQSIKTAQALDRPIETLLVEPITREKLAYLSLTVG
ncbi:MAG: imelysin family protein, partial [Notoacmeibacter sp.]